MRSRARYSPEVAQAPAAAGKPSAGKPAAGKWLAGARPRTLPAAVVPVAVGTAVAWSSRSIGHGIGAFPWWRAGCALVVALAVQVGTNYANDYSDGVRGTDDARQGPMRLVASGAASPSAVRAAAIAAFGLAGVAGLAIAAATSWWLVALGAACFAAGWLYTGGPHPYGYAGFGELFVFVFFGLVATVGTAYVLGGDQAHLLEVASLAALPAGLLAVALLLANNLRDIAGDSLTGKHTLAVRVGRRAAGWLYVAVLAGAVAGIAAVATWRPWALLALLGAPLAVRPTRLALSGAGGRDLLPMLADTGRLQLAAGLLLTVGILL